MIDITDDTGFKQALQGLDHASQRLLAARFVESVMSLATDDRIGHVVAVAGNPDAGETELAEVLHSARAATLACHTRCGSEGDWKEQAGYFVARAATAAVTAGGQAIRRACLAGGHERPYGPDRQVHRHRRRLRRAGTAVPVPSVVRIPKCPLTERTCHERTHCR